MSTFDTSIEEQALSRLDGQSENIRFWLALLLAPGVGPVKYKQLLELFGSPRELFSLPIASIKDRAGITESLRQYLRTPDWSGVDKILQWQKTGHNNHILNLTDPRYPQQLLELPDPPPILFVHGDASLLRFPQLAMVGSRNPSRMGDELACDFARYLSATGLVITSGLALGIDSASHRGALLGNGLTIAVAGTGLDRIYPAKNKTLAHEIAQQGALVSEFIPGTKPLAGNFPRRNRLISGLSMGTLVVEAALKSGSLITARFSMEQGREVFAIPGSIHNPLARGCHKLIREGAKLVETANDILEELGPMMSVNSAISAFIKDFAPKSDEFGLNQIERKTPNERDLSADQQHLLKIIGHEPSSIDYLVEQCHLTPESISSMLVELELLGCVSSAGGLYSRTSFKDI